MSPTKQPHAFQFPTRLLQLLRAEHKHRPPLECHEIGVMLSKLKTPYGTFGNQGWLPALIDQLPPDVPKPGRDVLERYYRFVRRYPEYDPSKFDGLSFEAINHLIKLRDDEVRETYLE